MLHSLSAGVLWDTHNSLRWRHNERDGVSNHQPRDCLRNRLFRRTPKKTSKLRVTGFCAGNSPVTGEFPTQRASNAENVSIWWRHHVVWSIPSDGNDVSQLGAILKYDSCYKAIFVVTGASAGCGVTLPALHLFIIHKLCWNVLIRAFIQYFFLEWYISVSRNNTKRTKTLTFHLEIPQIDCVVQDCSNSINNALELLQSCTKPSANNWM